MVCNVREQTKASRPISNYYYYYYYYIGSSSSSWEFSWGRQSGWQAIKPTGPLRIRQGCDEAVAKRENLNPALLCHPARRPWESRSQSSFDMLFLLRLWLWLSVRCATINQLQVKCKSLSISNDQLIVALIVGTKITGNETD